MINEIRWILAEAFNFVLINPLCHALYKRGYRGERITFGAAMHNAESIADELLAESDDLLQQDLLRILIAERNRRIYII